MKKRISLIILLISVHTKPWQPNFIILGEQKCATTSLYNSLILHSRVAPSQEKELYFFTRNFNKGIRWYQQQFPQNTQNKKLIGEASSDYLCDKRAPLRMKNFFSHTKFIVLLRDPIDRAISHFHHEKRLGREIKKTFEEAVSINLDKIYGNNQTPSTEEKNPPKHHEYLGDYEIYGNYGDYLRRGIYVKNLKRWFKHFPKEQFCILLFTDYTKNPQRTLDKVCNFLDIEKFNFPSHNNHYFGKYSENTSPHLRKKLEDFYRPYNKELELLLNIKLPWNN